MDYMTMFLEGREIFVDCGNGLERVALDNALKLMDRCTVYASLAKNSKATPALGIRVEKDVDWRILLSISVYVARLVKSLGLESTYVIFHWLGSDVLIHEDSVPVELFERFPKPAEAGHAISNYILKVIEDRLTKISRFFRGRVWFSTDLDKVIAPCSFIPEVGRRAIYIDIGNPEDLEAKIREETCIIGEPFRVRGIGQTIKHRLLNEVTTLITVKSTTLKSPPRALPKIIGRFEIMALLQAARYYVLSGDVNKAKSFGLNRAIFYAWAKYHRPTTRYLLPRYVETESSDNVVLSRSSSDKVVEDQIEIKNGYFVFSDQVQTPDDFDKSVKHKIDTIVPFEIIWDLTLRYVKMFEDNILRDPNKFYKYVYEPVRDTYMERIEDIIKAVPKDIDKSGKRKEVHRVERDIQAKPKLRRITEYIKSKD